MHSATFHLWKYYICTIKQKPCINNISFFIQKQPLRGVLQNKCSTTMIKTLEKCLRKNSFFSKVAGCRLATLLRMNSFSCCRTPSVGCICSWHFANKKANPGINSHDNFNNTYGKNVHEIKNKERSLLQNWVRGPSIAEIFKQFKLDSLLYSPRRNLFRIRSIYPSALLTCHMRFQWRLARHAIACWNTFSDYLLYSHCMPWLAKQIVERRCPQLWLEVFHQNHPDIRHDPESHFH